MPITYTVIHNFAGDTKGGELAVKDLKDLLNASYDPRDNVNDYALDKELSTNTSKVFYDSKSKRAVVAHKGTSGITDWFNNMIYGLGGKKLYKMTTRYKEAKKVQDAAAAKYGNSNISTIGHSQGGLQAEMLGSPTHETITLNKATRPFSNTKELNQYDVRTQHDIVSSLNPLQKYSPNDIIIDSDTKNPLTEHSIDTLERLDPNMKIGKANKKLLKDAIIGKGLVGSKMKEYMDDKLPVQVEIAIFKYVDIALYNACLRRNHFSLQERAPYRIVIQPSADRPQPEILRFPYRIQLFLNVDEGNQRLTWYIESKEDYDEIVPAFQREIRIGGLSTLPRIRYTTQEGEWL